MALLQMPQATPSVSFEIVDTYLQEKLQYTCDCYKAIDYFVLAIPEAGDIFLKQTMQW